MTATGRSTALATGAGRSEGGMADSPETLKIEARCKQCRRTFVKYAYQRTARCEACRKAGGGPEGAPGLRQSRDASVAPVTNRSR